MVLGPGERDRVTSSWEIPQPDQQLTILFRFLVSHRRVMVGLSQSQHTFGTRIGVHDLLLALLRYDAVALRRDEDRRGRGGGRVADRAQFRRDLPREQGGPKLQVRPAGACEDDFPQRRRVAEDQAGQRLMSGQSTGNIAIASFFEAVIASADGDRG